MVCNASSRKAPRWLARLFFPGRKILTLGSSFTSAEAAARAHDAAARLEGIVTLNFPRPGTDEVRAHSGMTTQKRRGVSNAQTRNDEELIAAAHRAAAGLELSPAAARTVVPGAQQRQKRSTPRVRPRPSALLFPPSPPQALSMPPRCPPRRPVLLNGSGGDADAAASADVASFLRAIRPPLSNLDTIVAALPGTGATMAHLRGVAASASALPAERMLAWLASAASALGVTSDVERVRVAGALLGLAASRR